MSQEIVLLRPKIRLAHDYITIESYYKMKWGYAQEFINLWMANHYPLQKKAKEKGDIISITTEKPKEHSGEDTRWDFKVTVVYKNAELALEHSIRMFIKRNFILTSSNWLKTNNTVLLF